jgi:hypothetical protein
MRQPNGTNGFGWGNLSGYAAIAARAIAITGRRRVEAAALHVTVWPCWTGRNGWHGHRRPSGTGETSGLIVGGLVLRIVSAGSIAMPKFSTHTAHLARRWGRIRRTGTQLASM